MTTTSPRIAVEPVALKPWLVDAVVEAGGEVVDVANAQGIVWCDPYGADLLEGILRQHHNISWVQLPFAGIEPFAHLINDGRVWSCGKGVYAEPVAEHVVGLLLAGFRNLHNYSRATSWTGPVGINLLGARITVVGGGGITESLVRLLQGFNCHITVVRNKVVDMPDVDSVVSSERLIDALPGADAVVLALSLTPETDGLISRDELALMEPHAWLVNVARGRHIVTDDLVEALRERRIGGAALDVTDPEPLPDNHPLWMLDNCIITPHVGNTPGMAIPLLSERIRENVKRFAAGTDLLGLVDPQLGY